MPIRTLKAKSDSEPLSKERLRLWLRLLSCSHAVQREIRRRFETDFDVTLPRFDVMAALNRHPEGLTMGSLSRWLRVSNGNVTGVVSRLEADGLVLRQSRPDDQRVMDVSLTEEGRKVFARLADAHEGWIDELLGSVDPDSMHRLIELLGSVRNAVDNRLERSR